MKQKQKSIDAALCAMPEGGGDVNQATWDVDQNSLDAATAICALPESMHPTQHKAKIQCIIAQAYLGCEHLREPSPPWRERWYGSEPQRGWSIMQGRELIAHIGGDESMSQAVSDIVMKHNGDDKSDGAKRELTRPSSSAPVERREAVRQAVRKVVIAPMLEGQPRKSLADRIADAILSLPGSSRNEVREKLHTFVVEHYANQDLNHMDFRVEAYVIAAALEQSKEK